MIITDVLIALEYCTVKIIVLVSITLRYKEALVRDTVQV